MHPCPQRWAGPEESTSSYKFDGKRNEPIRPLECCQRGELSSALVRQGVGMAILTDYFDDRNMMWGSPHGKRDSGTDLTQLEL